MGDSTFHKTVNFLSCPWWNPLDCSMPQQTKKRVPRDTVPEKHTAVSIVPHSRDSFDEGHTVQRSRSNAVPFFCVSQCQMLERQIRPITNESRQLWYTRMAERERSNRSLLRQHTTAYTCIVRNNIILSHTAFLMFVLHCHAHATIRSRFSNSKSTRCNFINIYRSSKIGDINYSVLILPF